MTIKEHYKLQSLVNDWRNRANGLSAKAQTIGTPDWEVRDFRGKATAYQFAALDLEAVLNSMRPISNCED